MQAERDEKMEAVRDVDVNGASNTYNETISAVSAISDSLLKNLTQIKSTNSRGEAKSQARESQEDVQVVRLTS